MRGLMFRAVLPALLAVLLFIGAVYLVMVPSLERSLLEQKHKKIKELNSSAWNILQKFHHDEQQGLLTREEAQRAALAQIRNLHFGAELKDYFWISDMQPRMVSHPYRADLVGRDLREVVDPRGVRVFSEFVRLVENQDAGFVTHRWQWKDDPTRTLPKLTYVQGFKPWGWIVGTGVYLDDIPEELRAFEWTGLIITKVIVIIISIPLFLLLRETALTVRHHRRAETALRRSEQRYRTLVESAGEFILMSLPDERLFVNPSLSRMLGYEPWELERMTIDRLLLPPTTATEPDFGAFRCLRTFTVTAPTRFEALLHRKDGSNVPVVVSASPMALGQRHGFIAVVSEIADHHGSETAADRLIHELQVDAQFWNHPIGDLCSPAHSAPPFADTTGCTVAPTTVSETTNRTDRPPTPASTVVSPALAAADPLAAPGSATAPVAAATPLYEVLARHRGPSGWPIHVADARGAIIGHLTAADVLEAVACRPATVLRSISAAETPAALARAVRRLAPVAEVMVSVGTRPHLVTRLLTRGCEAAVTRAVEFAVGQAGPAPTPFALMVMGSVARRETTLFTDQDNAIVYADVPPDREPAVSDWLRQIGAQVNAWLLEAGYPRCDGGLMAGNPTWCRPLSAWKRIFSHWMSVMEPEELLRTRIFFDFRPVVGNTALTDALHEHIRLDLPHHPRFPLLLARDILQFEPPLSLFGGFVLQTADGRQGIDLKRILTLIVDLARIYALRHGIAMVGTHERLDRLRQAGALSEDSHRDLARTFDLLMQLRLDHQVWARRHGVAASNLLDPSSLPAPDQRMLLDLLRVIKDFQVRLSYDFTGMMAPG